MTDTFGDRDQTKRWRFYQRQSTGRLGSMCISMTTYRGSSQGCQCGKDTVGQWDGGGLGLLVVSDRTRIVRGKFKYACTIRVVLINNSPVKKVS